METRGVYGRPGSRARPDPSVSVCAGIRLSRGGESTQTSRLVNFAISVILLSSYKTKFVVSIIPWIIVSVQLG